MLGTILGTSLVLLPLLLFLVVFLGIQTTSPQPAKQAAFRAYNVYGMATFTVGVKAANVINVAVQLLDARAQNPGQEVYCSFYLSSDAGGLTPSPTAPTSALAIGTRGGLLDIWSTNVGGDVVTDIQGRFDINVTQTAGGTAYYFNVCLPDGSILTSPIVQF